MSIKVLTILLKLLKKDDIIVFSACIFALFLQDTDAPTQQKKGKNDATTQQNQRR